MGTSNSKPPGSVKDVVMPVLNPITGSMLILSPQYIAPGPAPSVFRLPERWYTGPRHTVREAYSNSVLMSTEGMRPGSGKLKQVRNADGSYAFGLKQVAASMAQPPHILYLPNGQEVTKILVDCGTLKAMVRARVYDQAKGGNAVVIHFLFNFRNYTGTMYYGDPKEGAPAIANVYHNHPDLQKEKHHYFMSVAAGADVGICTAFCIALSEIKHRNE